MESQTTEPDPGLEKLYEDAVKLHGHMCPGVILGVRMAVAGMHALEVDPFSPGRALRVTVETRRCATDAVQSATHCSLGLGSLSVRDSGKMAAVFSLADTSRAFRVFALESSREAADRLMPEVEGRHERQTRAYRVLADDVMFQVTPVELLTPARGHGKTPREKASCPQCGEEFDVSKGTRAKEGLLCANCGGKAYFRTLSKAPPTG